jgi:hypothetical protein
MRQTFRSRLFRSLLAEKAFSSDYHSPATLCTFFLQILPFMLIHKPLFRLCPTEAIVVKSASIISNVVRAVDSGLINSSYSLVKSNKNNVGIEIIKDMSRSPGIRKGNVFASLPRFSINPVAAGPILQPLPCCFTNLSLSEDVKGSGYHRGVAL